MRWRRLIGTLLGVGSLLGLLFYGFYRDPRYIPSPLVGNPAPPFTVELFNGNNVSLADMRGKTILINFWASWCLPCRDEARDLEAAWHGYKEDPDANVVFLGINIQDKRKEALAFMKEFGITFANGRDADGRISVDYGVWGIPEAFFVSPEGTITYKHVGALSWPVLTAKLHDAQQARITHEDGKGAYQPIK